MTEYKNKAWILIDFDLIITNMYMVNDLTINSVKNNDRNLAETIHFTFLAKGAFSDTVLFREITCAAICFRY